MIPVQLSSAVRNLEPVQDPGGEVSPPGPHLVTGVGNVDPSSRTPMQAPLFGPQSLQPGRQASRRNAKGEPKPRRDPDAQRSLNLEGTQDGARTLPTLVDASVWCNAPVAIAPRRIVACLADTALCGAGFGVFLATLYLTGVPLLTGKAALLTYSSAFLGVFLLYRLIYCFVQADSIGLQFSGLRLLNFDGQQPSQHQRLLRIGGGVVSVISAGMGLAWTAVDEERLSWHDHISETFPTPRT